MPRDVSSSSSEDEEEQQRPGSADRPQPAPRPSSRFQVPADFVPLSLTPCSGTDSNELWLIKAPVNFDPQRLRGVPVSLSGLQTLKVATPGGGASPQVYSVLASNQGPADLRLVERRSPGGVALAPPFSGLLNVCDRHGDGDDLTPRVIAAATPPAVPAGLKQRFIPFGCRNAAGTSNAPSPSIHHLEEEEEDGARKRRKKKKKEKKEIKMENEEVDGVKEEVQEEEVVTKRRKEEVEEVKVKEEPTDCCYGNVEEEERKKKKKKKKKKKMEDE